MTTPNPTPEQNLPAGPNSEETRADSADENNLPQKATGFFNRVQRELKSEPVHPSEAAEIVIMPGEKGDGPSEKA